MSKSPGDGAMNRAYVAIAIIIPALLVIGGAYFYSITPTRPEKPVVVLPTKYVGNIYYFDYSAPYTTFENKTPLSEYWEREYLKNRTWTISANNITLTIVPVDLECLGDYESQFPRFLVVLNSSEYIEKVTYISDARYIEEKNGVTAVLIDVPEEYSNRVVKKLIGYRNSYEVVIFNVQQSNFTMKTYSYADIYERRVKAPLPYNFTAYIETKDKVYEMKFVFNLLDEHYPFLDLQDLYYMGNYSFYIPGAKYFCYTPYGKNKVVISNHIVPGTKYFFAEKDGVLSAITRYLPEQKYVKRDFYVNKLFYFTPNELNATILNSTPLAKYWEKEYLKSYEWEMNMGSILMEVYPIYFLGYNGTSLGYNTTKGQLILNSIVNSTKYVGNITYTLNALKAIPLNGAYFDTGVVPHKNPLNNGVHYKRVYRNYMEYWQEVKYAFNTENFTFSSQLYLNISYWTASEIPYSVTITVEQKDYYHDILENVTYYTLQIHFNLTREEYPFLNPNITGHNVTYFCYNSTWGKVVISDHFVEGTEYYFVEKNGTLSEIWSVEEVKNYGR